MLLTHLRDTQLLRGCGFAVIRSIPVEAWGDARAAAAFLVLSQAIGNLRMQNGAGHVLGRKVDGCIFGALNASGTVCALRT